MCTDSDYVYATHSSMHFIYVSRFQLTDFRYGAMCVRLFSTIIRCGAGLSILYDCYYCILSGENGIILRFRKEIYECLISSLL